MKLSVVILNYNVQYFLELCLKSVIAATSEIHSEIIVVDNKSNDDSCNMVKTLFPKVKLIENNENLGFSKGNNIGVAQAKGVYVCILNPDVVLAEDAFKTILSFVHNKEDVGIVGCKLINGNGEFLPESKRNIPYVKVSLKKILGNSNDYYANNLNENESGKVDILVGAFMFLKRSLYNEIKGFDEDYFMYGEDIDLSYKILKRGYSNYYFAGTTAIHFKGESTLKDKNYARRFYGAMQIFYKKHFKKNILFDISVWLGIMAFYLVRTKPTLRLKQIRYYILISNKINVELKLVLKKPMYLKSYQDSYEKGTEVIFDANMLSYRTIIEAIENKAKDKSVTFKILPKNSNFVIGSDDAFAKGEIIKFCK